MAVSDWISRPAAVRRPASPLRGPSAWNGSGSARPSTQSATYSASAGPCLKPCPEPPPSSHHDACSGWRSKTKCVSAVRSYWQTRPPTTGGLRERREAARRVLARDLLELGATAAGRACRGRRSRRAGRARSSRRARRSRRGRRTAPSYSQKPGVPRHAASAPKKKTSRREIFSSTRPGKNCGSQEPQAQTTTSAAGSIVRASTRPCSRQHAAALAVLDEQLRRAPRVQDARLRLEQHGMEVVGLERRVEVARVVGASATRTARRRPRASPGSAARSRPPAARTTRRRPAPRCACRSLPAGRARSCARGARAACTTRHCRAPHARGACRRRSRSARCPACTARPASRPSRAAPAPARWRRRRLPHRRRWRCSCPMYTAADATRVRRRARRAASRRTARARPAPARPPRPRVSRRRRRRQVGGGARVLRGRDAEAGMQRQRRGASVPGRRAERASERARRAHPSCP